MNILIDMFTAKCELPAGLCVEHFQCFYDYFNMLYQQQDYKLIH